MVCYTREGEMGEREERKNCHAACTPGRGVGKGSAIYPGVEWPTTRVELTLETGFVSFRWPIVRSR